MSLPLPPTPLYQQLKGVDTLFKLACHRAKAQPRAVGFTYLVDGETTEKNLTYAELDFRCKAIAARLQAVCQPGENVLLLYGPGLDYIAAFFACQYAGVVPVPAYPPDPMRSQGTLSRLQAIIADCGAALALGARESLDGLGYLKTNELGLRQTLATDDWQDWIGLPWKAPETDAEQLAWLQYTSGSTGMPRGVMVTQRNLWSQFATMQVGDGEDTVGVTWLPLYHDMGLVGGILTPMAFGRRTVVMSPLSFVQHPLRWLLALSRYRGTITGAPNFAFDLCVSKFSPEEATNLDLSSLRFLLTGAEPIRSDSLNRFMTTFAPYGLRPDVWWPSYGMAEATLGITGLRHGSQLRRADFSILALENNLAVPVTDAAIPSRRMVGCGWAIEGTEAIVVDPCRCIELPERHVGEIWVQGPNVARGYWNRPEETDAVFQGRLADSGRGPFLRTGDLGFRYEGQFYLTGRSKDVMVFWGRNVYPQDVEASTWSCHPSLKQYASAAFAVEVEGQERLVVVQEITRPRKMDLPAVADAIRQAIETEHRVPVHSLVFIKAGTLPKTSSGKVQRARTRELYLNQQLDVIQQWVYPSVVTTQPASIGQEQPLRSYQDIHAWLIARIARHCKIAEDQIDPREALTSYVLDSVSAVSIAMEMQQWLGRAIAPTVLYDSPSVSVLAERLANPELCGPGKDLPMAVAVDQMSQEEVDQALARLLSGTTPAPPLPDESSSPFSAG